MAVNEIQYNNTESTLLHLKPNSECMDTDRDTDPVFDK